MSTEKIITGEDVLLIKKTNLLRAYKSETEGFKGKSYRIYAFGDNAFAVHEDDDFHNEFTNGGLKTIMLTVTDEGWSLANCVTWKQANAQRKNQVVFDSITVENFVRSTVASLEETV